MARTQVVHASTSRTQDGRQQPGSGTLDYEPPNDTISPRSDEITPSSTDNQRAHRSRESSSKTRSRKHRDKKSRSHDVARSDSSQNQLLHIVMEQEQEADALKRALSKTLEDLEEKKLQLAEYEKGSKESAERFMKVNESRLAAEQEATRATSQLHVYEFQLQKAESEMATTQETLKILERQKQEAEEMAARARAKARKLLQKQVILEAKEEGRRSGFEAGIKQAQEEIAISTTARRAFSHTLPESSRSRRGSRRPQIPEGPTHGSHLPEQPSEDHRQHDIPGHRDTSGGNETVKPTSGLADLTDSDTLQSPVLKHRSLYPAPADKRRPRSTSAHDPGPSTLQAAQNEEQLIRTPEIQRYAISIPPADEITHPPPQGRRPGPEGWVTAQVHRDINGSQTSQSTPRQGHQRSVSEPLRDEVQPSEVRFAPPPPAPVFLPAPSTAQGYGQAPPKSSGTIKRFGSIKNKAQSWYRKFSRRKKNKPVIDPIDEEPEYHQDSVVETNGVAGHPNAQMNGQPSAEAHDQEDSEFQPSNPKSWYQEQRRSEDGKISNSRLDLPKAHSRVGSMALGGDRVSRASTHMSQISILSPPRTARPDHTDATSSQQLAQKLSVLQSDVPRGFTPSHITPFSIPPASTRTGKSRPPGISVPPPPGFSPNNPFVHGNFHVVPEGGLPAIAPPLQSAAASSRSAINIDVHPATAAAPVSQPPSAGVGPNTGNHLTPNYVYHARSPSVRSSLSKRDPVPVSWDVPPPSNVSRHSRQSQSHRITQSLDVPPQAMQENRSMRSGHSRAASATAQQVLYPTERVQSMGGMSQQRPASRTSRQMEPMHQSTSPRPSEGRPASRAFRAMPSNYDQQASHPVGSRTPAAGTTGQYLTDDREIHRVSSRNSMHSKYDPTTYVDPAYYEPDGSTTPALLHPSPNGRIQRPRSTSSLSYVDP